MSGNGPRCVPRGHRQTADFGRAGGPPANAGGRRPRAGARGGNSRGFPTNTKSVFIARCIFIGSVRGMGAALKIGITGLPGAGKTYCLLKVIEMLEGDGLKVGGMITEPIVKRNRREGFYVMDWATKEKRVFASREITS